MGKVNIKARVLSGQEFNQGLERSGKSQGHVVHGKYQGLGWKRYNTWVLLETRLISGYRVQAR